MTVLTELSKSVSTITLSYWLNWLGESVEVYNSMLLLPKNFSFLKKTTMKWCYVYVRPVEGGSSWRVACLMILWNAQSLLTQPTSWWLPKYHSSTCSDMVFLVYNCCQKTVLQVSYHNYMYYFKASCSVCCMILLIFSNKSHNMKAVIILSHSWSPFFLFTFDMEKMNFCGALCPLLEYFRKKKLQQFQEN